MDKKDDMQAGDVIQIDISHDPAMFGGSLIIVTEVYPWGIQGYTHIPGADGGGDAFVRCKWENMEFVGRATWMRQ